jgi:hypothetical protein
MAGGEDLFAALRFFHGKLVLRRRDNHRYERPTYGVGERGECMPPRVVRFAAGRSCAQLLSDPAPDLARLPSMLRGSTVSGYGE